MPKTKGHLTLLPYPAQMLMREPDGQNSANSDGAENLRLTVATVKSTFDWVMKNRGVLGLIHNANGVTDPTQPVPVHTGEGLIAARLSVSTKLASVDKRAAATSLKIAFQGVALTNEAPVESFTFHADAPEVVAVSYQPEISQVLGTMGMVIHRNPMHTAERDFTLGNPTYLFAACALVSVVERLRN